MPRLPAFCPSCGGVFASPLRASGPGDGTAFDVPTPCPGCGGSGTVPAELLALTARVAEWIAGPEGDRDQLRAFVELLEEGVDGEVEDEALLLETARRAPDLVELARRLPTGPPGVLRGFGALFRRVAARTSEGDGDPADVARGAVERLLDEEAMEPAEDEIPPELEEARSRLDGTGRNDACPCGSGKKYKDCHWMEDLRITRA